MKTPLILLFLLAGFNLLAQDQKASKKDYDNIAADMCACVNKNCVELSDGLKSIYIQYADTTQLMMEKMTEYYENNMEAATKDMEVLDKVAENVDLCIGSLEERYANIYADENQDEIQALILQHLKGRSGCELTYALFKILDSSESTEDYYDYYDEEGE